jgi:hypothetical protein
MQNTPYTGAALRFNQFMYPTPFIAKCEEISALA